MTRPVACAACAVVLLVLLAARAPAQDAAKDRTAAPPAATGAQALPAAAEPQVPPPAKATRPAPAHEAREVRLPEEVVNGRVVRPHVHVILKRGKPAPGALPLDRDDAVRQVEKPLKGPAF
jgi:hypothetical protein